MEQIEQKQQLWRYVPLSDYTVPQATMSRTIKGGIRGMWQRIRVAKKKPGDPQKTESDLQHIPNVVLENITPNPDRQLPAGFLKTSLDERLGAKPNEKFTLLVVGLPHSGNAETLTVLARALNWPLIPAPSAEQILSRDTNWLKQMEKPDTPWVVPALEKCYLRHVHGLALVRQMFEKINTGAMGNGIIGCDSWALAYLKHVVPVRLPDALIAEAFDDHKLCRWFYQLASGRFRKPIHFRQTDKGEFVLPCEPEPVEPDKAGTKTSAFINQLAAYSRGIPGIALCLWRKALRKEPDKTVTDKTLSETPSDIKTTIWVLPWNKLEHPTLPCPISPESSIFLHSLLLHNGLSQSILAEILPFSSNLITRILLVLKDAGLIEENDGLWKVSPSGYPIVRSYLNGEGYLTDQF
ncbi:MAG: hypothetical protein JW786_10770 [Desulfobacterales bacterium]|nr:hypothetical protein [Desulfobacterales bacterium]